MEIFPAEIYPIILSYADFSLWRTARYVSRGWNNIIMMNQCVQICNFIRMGRLPNGARHGYIKRAYFDCIEFYDIFRYDQKIAKVVYADNQLTDHEIFNKTGLISFIKNTRDCYIVDLTESTTVYRLRFQINHIEFFYIDFNEYLDMKIIFIKDCKYFCTYNNPFLFAKYS